MTLRHIHIFRVLCEYQYNTTKAAQALHMTQPAVSLAVKEMEQHYNVVLFDRIGRRLVITQAGMRLAEYCNSIENLFENMEAELSHWDKQCTIRTGCTLTIGSLLLPKQIKAFKKLYPDIDITGLCAPAYVLEKKILNNELDIAFSEGLIVNPLIETEVYMTDRLVVFASRESGYTPWQEISLQQFTASPVILREKESGTRKTFDRACEKLGFSVTPVWESMNTSGVISAVANGMGLGVLSYLLVEKLIKEGELIPLTLTGLDLSRNFYIIHHRDKQLTPAIKNFIAMLKDTE